MTRTYSIGQEHIQSTLDRLFPPQAPLLLLVDEIAYTSSGAETLFQPYWQRFHITQCTITSANPKYRDVIALLASLPRVSWKGIIAIGGGSTLDTAKLLKYKLCIGAFPFEREHSLNTPPPSLPFPLLAIPTTAGTGAEATAFAVCYQDAIKHSIEHPKIRPDYALLIPELTATLPPYLRASTGFDACAQAVESFWAKGATKESLGYAVTALRHLQALPDALQSPLPKNLFPLCLGAYWAGCAINISKTTAAHAFSYALTSQYGIPHGHAVAMVFPYVLKWNLRNGIRLPDSLPPFISSSPTLISSTLGLESLYDFSLRIHIPFQKLTDFLSRSVNHARLSNNPCPIDSSIWNLDLFQPKQ